MARAVAEARSVGPWADLAVAVLHGEQQWQHTSGKATADSSFRVASITKTFTAAAVLRLAEAGALSLDEDVRTYVPDFPEKSAVVTPRRLLNHTAGVGHYTSLRDGRTTTPHTTAQSLALFKDRQLLAPPGEMFVYSSYGYVLLGALIEQVSGKPYDAYLDEAFFTPLGLTATGQEANPATKANRLPGYSVGLRGLSSATKLDTSSRFSSGGLRSTLNDLTRWARAWLDGAVLSPASFREVMTPTSTTKGLDTDFGAGFAVYPSRGRRVVAHAGGQPGASALLLLVPAENAAVVILHNVTARGPDVSRLANALLDVVLDEGAPRHWYAAATPVDEVRLSALARAMSHGVAAFRAGEKYERPAIAAAFAWAEETLSPEFDAAVTDEAVRAAHHAVNGRRTPLLGYEVARVLHERGGAEALNSAARAGALELFAAYLAVCAQKPCAHPLPPGLAAHVARLAAAWQTLPANVKTLRFDVDTQADAVLEQLAVLDGAAVAPDFTGELTRLAVRERLGRRVKQAQQVLEATARWYPASALARLALAEDAALRGKKTQAITLLKEAVELRPTLFNAEFLKIRAETMRVGQSAEGAAALNSLYTRATARAAQ